MTHQKTKQQVLTLENKEQKEGKQYFWRKEWNLKKTEFQEGTCDGLVSHSGGELQYLQFLQAKGTSELQLDESLCSSADFTFLQVWGGVGH